MKSLMIAAAAVSVLSIGSAHAQEDFLRDYGAGKVLDYFLQKHEQSYRNLGYSPFYPMIPGPTSRDMRPRLPTDPYQLEKLERKGRTG